MHPLEQASHAVGDGHPISPGALFGRGKILPALEPHVVVKRNGITNRSHPDAQDRFAVHRRDEPVRPTEKWLARRILPDEVETAENVLDGRSAKRILVQVDLDHRIAVDRPEKLAFPALAERMVLATYGRSVS